MIPTSNRAFGAACFLTLATTSLAKVPASSPTAGQVEAWVRQVQRANALMDTGEFDRAAGAYQSALDSAERDGDDLRVGIVPQNIGGLLDRKGLARQAGHAYLRAIQALERAAGDDDRVLVRAYVGLTTAYIQTGQYSRAETLIQRVLAEHPAGTASDRASLMETLFALSQK